MGDRGRKRDREDDNNNGDDSLVLAAAFCKLGDQTKGVEEKVQAFARDLEDEIDYRGDMIADMCIQGSHDMAHKVGVYATLVGLLNRRNGHFGANVVDQLGVRFDKAIRRGECSECKVLLIIASELVAARALTHASLVSALTKLAEATALEDSPLEMRTYYAWLLASALPFAGRALTSVGLQSEVAAIHTQVERFMAQYTSRAPSQSVLAMWTDGRGSGGADDRVAEAWDCACAYNDSSWAAVKGISFPQDHFKAELEKADAHPLRLSDLPKELPIKHTEMIAGLRAVPCRLVEDSDEDHLRKHDAYVYAGVIRDIISSCDTIHSDCPMPMVADCARILAMLPSRPRTLVVNVIFGELMLLPHSPAPLAYYCMVLATLCKLDPKYEALVVSATHAMFEDAPSLEVECFDRITEWFALFLSQFKFEWAPWFVQEEDGNDAKGLAVTWGEMLANDTGSSDSASRHRDFVSQLLARCIRLGGYERFAEEDQSSRSIPASLRNCLPPAPNPGASEESDSFSELQALVKKGDERAVVEFVDQNYSSRDAPARAAIVFEALLESSHRIPSICWRRFHKNEMLLKSFATTIEARTAAFDALLEFWKDSPQAPLLLVPNLLVAGVIDTKAMVHSLLSAQHLPRLATQSHLFELLEQALQHVVSLSLKLETELAARSGGPTDDARQHEWQTRTTQLHQKALRMQKETFLALFEKLGQGIAQHIAECRSNDQPEGTWVPWAVARLKQCGRKYSTQIKPFMATLESVVISGIDEMRVNEAFEAFKDF